MTLHLDGNEVATIDEIFYDGLGMNRSLAVLSLMGNRIRLQDKDRLRQAKSEVMYGLYL